MNLLQNYHNEQANEQASELPNATPNAQADEHIITKLNLLFNYIYNKGSGRKIGLTEKDREPLILILRHLELYAEDTIAYDYMSEDKVLDQKIMIWAVKEIYLSPHKVFLNSLKKDKFYMRYLKTKKYITEKADYQVRELVSYFIVCLHEELENEKGYR